MSHTSMRAKIAVIGSGAAGITAACLLQKDLEVTLYEKSGTLGGHAQSVTIDNGLDSPFDVDTAFVIFNSRSYPLFLRLLARFGLETRVRKAEMSFSYVDASKGLSYALHRGLRAMLRPQVYSVIPELIRFRLSAARDLVGMRNLSELTLSQYLAQRRYSPVFAENFIYPTAMAVWSISAARIQEFPASAFLRFLDNHGYLGGGRGRWLTLSGGCRQYVRAFQSNFTGTVKLGHDVASVTRASSGVTIQIRDGSTEHYDKVVLATHADQALKLLADPSADERRCLGAWTYQKSPTVLHEDASVMPADKSLWASWNIAGAAVTYHLNRVQGFSSQKDYFVTLGEGRIDEKKVVARFDYEHPIFDFRATRAQGELSTLNGQAQTYFCGSYFGFGFHEDAVRSAVEVARVLGADGL